MKLKLYTRLPGETLMKNEIRPAQNVLLLSTLAQTQRYCQSVSGCPHINIEIWVAVSVLNPEVNTCTEFQAHG